MKEDASTEKSVGSSLQTIFQAISKLSFVLRKHKEEFLLITVNSTRRTFCTGSVLGKDYLDSNKHVMVNFIQHCTKDGDVPVTLKGKCSPDVSLQPETHNSEIRNEENSSTLRVHCVQEIVSGNIESQENNSTDSLCEHDCNITKVKFSAESVTQPTTTNSTIHNSASISQHTTTNSTIHNSPSISQPITTTTINTVHNLPSVSQPTTTTTIDTVHNLPSVSQPTTTTTVDTVHNLPSVSQPITTTTINTVHNLPSVSQPITTTTINTVHNLPSVSQPTVTKTVDTVHTSKLSCISKPTTTSIDGVNNFSSISQSPMTTTFDTVQNLSSVSQAATPATDNTVYKLPSASQPLTVNKDIIEKIFCVTQPSTSTTNNTVEILTNIIQPSKNTEKPFSIIQPPTSTTDNAAKQPSSVTKSEASTASNTVHRLTGIKPMMVKKSTSLEHAHILGKYKVKERRDRCIYLPQSVTKEAEESGGAYSHILNSEDSASIFGDLSGLIKVKSLKSLIQERKYMDDWIIGDIDDQEIDLEDMFDDHEFIYKIVNGDAGSERNNRIVTSGKDLAYPSLGSAGHGASSDAKTAPEGNTWGKNHTYLKADACLKADKYQEEGTTSDDIDTNTNDLEFQCLDTNGEEEVLYAEISLDNNLENESVSVCMDNTIDVHNNQEAESEGIDVENDTENLNADHCGWTQKMVENNSAIAFALKDPLKNSTRNMSETCNEEKRHDPRYVTPHSTERPEIIGIVDSHSDLQIASLNDLLNYTTEVEENTDSYKSNDIGTRHDNKTADVVSEILQQGNSDMFDSKMLVEKGHVFCTYCSIYFPNDYSLQLHIEYNHSSEASSKTQSCELSSAHNSSCQAPDYKKSIAHSELSKQRENLGSHTKWHRSLCFGSTRKRRKADSYEKHPQPCEHCHRTFVNGFGLRIHQRTCTGVSDDDKRPKITNSNKEEKEFKDNLRSRCTFQTGMTCLICQEKHDSLDSVTYHIKMKHKFKLPRMVNLVHCSGCGQKFDLLSEVQSHIETQNSFHQYRDDSGLKENIISKMGNKEIYCQENQNDNKFIKHKTCHSMQTLNVSGECCDSLQEKCITSEIQQSLKCSECSITCSSISKLKAHMERTHNVTVSCPVCKKFLVSEKNITEDCCTCGKTKDDSAAVGNGHSRKRKQEFNWKCHFCYQQFSSVTTLKQHLYLCPENNDSDTYIDVLDETESETAVNNLKYDVLKNKDIENKTEKRRKTEVVEKLCKNICEKCGTTYKNEKLLTSHQKHYHASKQCSNEYKCDICGKLFSKEISLNAHMHICSNRSNANSGHVKKLVSKTR